MKLQNNKPNKHTKFEEYDDNDDYNFEKEMVESSKKWYDEVPEDPGEYPSVTEMQLIDLKDEAKKLLDAETLAFNTRNAKANKSSDYQWIKTVLSKGTASDKVAAYTVLIQDNPIYNLKTIQDLVGMVKVGKKNDCLIVIQTLSELFLSDLLKPDQKLKLFYERPLSQLSQLTSGNIVTRKRRLILWYFEDQLKETYSNFVKALATAAHDSVDATKEKAINAMYVMLAGHPEQEKNLLVNIVNKLGDPSQKVASKTIYCLGQLLYKHPNMKLVVLMEIEKLLFRPNVSHKAQYYSICFLSQYHLTHDDFECAKHLITVYFAFFKACVKKDEVNSRMMSALLMGVNRAYPFAKFELEQVTGHINTMYKVVHQANFNVGLHALSLLFQVCDLKDSINDRFYSALYKKIIDPQVNNTTHQAVFLNLIFKALRKDTSLNRVNVFIKRLLQVCLSCSVPLACAVLYTISQVCRFKKIKLRLHHPNCIDLKEPSKDGTEQETSKQPKPSKTNNSNELIVNTAILTPVAASENRETQKSQETEDTKLVLRNNFYDPYNRNPLFAGGQYCLHSELASLQLHFHPTVALFSKNLANGQKIVYTGDPLKDFTLIRFLDRFVFKNPKKVDEIVEDNDSKIHKGHHFKFGQRKEYVPYGLRAIPITSNAYLKELPAKIPVDELFMYTYLQKKMQHQKVKKEDEDVEASDVESVDSDDFNDMLDNMPGFKTKGSDDEDDIDFMNEVGESLQSTSKSGKSKKEDDEDVDDEEDDEDDDENEMSDIEDDGFDSELGSGSDFGDELEDEEEVWEEDEPKAKKLKKKTDLNSVFASADEFAMMLENTGASGKKAGSANALSNEDNAAQKQVAWEEKRNQWISGFKKTVGKNKSKKSNGNKKRKIKK